MFNFKISEEIILECDTFLTETVLLIFKDETDLRYIAHLKDVIVTNSEFSKDATITKMQ